MITAPVYLCIAALCGIILIGGVIYSVIQDKRHPETRMCPSCGHVLQYKNTVNIPDPNCSICHGTGQGNGGYTGDSGECELRHESGGLPVLRESVVMEHVCAGQSN